MRFAEGEQNQEHFEDLNGIMLDEQAKERIMGGITRKLEKRRKWNKGIRICAFLAVFILLPSMPSIAKAVYTVAERMAQMNGREMDFYRTLIENSAGESFTYSREWTNGERDRWEILKKAYVYEDNYPDHEIRILEEGEGPEAGKVCYDPETGTIWLPQAEMSDEDMLQILDFFAKSDYSFRIRTREQDTAKPPVGASEEAVGDSELRKTASCLSAFFEEEIVPEQLEGKILGECYLYVLKKEKKKPSDYEVWQIQTDMETGEPVVIEAVDEDGKTAETKEMTEGMLTERWESDFVPLFLKGREYLDRIGGLQGKTEYRCLACFGEKGDRLTRLIRFYYIGEETVYEMIYAVETGQICLMRKTSDREAFMQRKLAEIQHRTEGQDGLRYAIFSLDEEGNRIKLLSGG